MKKIKSLYLLVLIISAGLIFLQSCVKEEYDFSKFKLENWDPAFAFPLVNSSLTINDILVEADKNGNIQVGSDGFCTLVYHGNLFSRRVNEFIYIAPQNLSPYTLGMTTIGVNAFNNASDGSNLGPFTQTLSYTLGTSYQIDSLFLKQGTTLALSYNNQTPGDLSVTVTIPELTLEQSPYSTFSQTFTVPANASANQSFELGDYLLRLNDGMGNRNLFTINYSVNITKPSGAGQANSSQSINLTPSLTNIGFDKFVGYIGTALSSLSPDLDTVAIGLFGNNDGQGTFSVVDASMTATVTNYLGCGLKLSFSKLDAFTDNGTGGSTNNNTLIGSSVLNNVLIIPAFGFDIPGITTISLTSTNSTVVPFINSAPHNVIYKVDAFANPGSSGYVRNFFTDTSMFKVDLDINLPLYGNATGFALNDTTDFSFDGLSSVSSLNLRTYFNSGFPVDMTVGIVFVDSLYQPVYTLIPAGTLLIKGAGVDANGMVNSKSEARGDYTIGKGGIENLKKAKYTIVKAVAATTGNGSQNVKIYNHYKLDVRLGLQIQPDLSVRN